MLRHRQVFDRPPGAASFRLKEETMLSPIAVLAGFGVLTSLVAGAVRADDIEAGPRVRLVLEGVHSKPVVGRLVESDTEALTVRTGKGEPRRVLMTEVRRMDVSRRPSRRGRGALIGLAVGTVGGFIL